MIYAVLLYFVALLIIAIKKHYWGVSIFMIALYIFSLCFSVALVSINNIDHISFLPSAVFCVALTLLFAPYFIKAPSIKAPSEIEIKRLVLVFSLISIVFIVCDIIISPAIVLAYLSGANEIRSGNAEVFSAMFTGYRSYIYFIISSFFGLSYLLIIIFFYSCAFIRGRIGFKALLLLASLTSPYLGILDGGRTNIIYWVLMAISGFICFKPYFNKKIKTKTYLVLVIPFLVLVFLFISATNDRFTERDGGANASLIDYIGQPFVNFCFFVENFNTPSYTLHRILPRLSSLFDGPFNLDQYRSFIMSTSHMDIGIFYTLLGDLLVDVGYIGMFAYIIFYMGICKGVFRRKQFDLSDIIILSLLLQVPIHGVFYYSLWSIKASNAMVMTFLLYCFFKFFGKTKISI